MKKSLIQNSVLALCLFVVVVILAYTNMEFTEPVTEYVSFVVSTNISAQPFLQKIGIEEKWSTWDFRSLFDGWSQATFGW